MKFIPRLYVASVLREGADVTLSEDQTHYLLHVMRMKTADTLHLFNGHDGEWQAQIESATKRSMCLRVIAQTRPQISVPNMVVCIAPVKHGRLEDMVEKATELGARRIVPVITQRTVVTRVNAEKLRSIAVAAAQQCERLDVPDLYPPQDFMQTIAQWDASTPLIYGDESGASPPFCAAALSPQVAQNGWGVLVGPEGGFSPEELGALRAANFAHGVSLGPRILRADTACTTLCAFTMQQLGDWHARPAFRNAD